MLTIYGADLSGPSNKVRFVANKLGLEYEYLRVNLMKEENKTEDHLKRHPAGKVPVIEEEGFKLFESNAIIKYLAGKAGSSLYPEQAKARAIVEQWIDFSSHHIGAAMNRVMFNRVLAPFMKMDIDERSLSDGLSFLDRFLPIVDNQLQANPYLAGSELTLADLCLLALIDPAEIANIDLSGYPSLSRWRGNLQGQPFYTKCHKSYEDAVKAAMGG
jgi:glutathione S-transferase